MFNQAAEEAAFIETYLDIVEEVPNDIQRHISRMRELDIINTTHLKNIVRDNTVLSRQKSSETIYFKRVNKRLQKAMFAAQEIMAEKLEVAQKIQDLVQIHTQKLDLQLDNLDAGILNQENTGQNTQTHHDVAGGSGMVNTSSTAGPSGSGNVNTSRTASASKRQSRADRRMQRGTLTVATTVTPEVIVTPEPVITQGITAADPVASTSGSIAKQGTAGKKKKRQYQQPQQQQRQREVSPPRKEDSLTVATTVTPEVIATPELVITQGITAADPVASTSGSIAKQGTAGKKKKRQYQQPQQQQRQREVSPPRKEDSTTDSDETTYCLCDKVSYGDMILCDNGFCPIAWFHFPCVNLVHKPKGKRMWFCPNCRGDRANKIKPKAQFYEELEKYKKENEEKA